MTWFLNVGIEPMVVKSDKDGWLESFSYVVIPEPESSWAFYTRMAQNQATAEFIRKGQEAAAICEGLDALERDWQRAHKVNPTP